jgi:hypothetical protein
MQHDPQSHPVFEIDGKKYELKFRSGDVIDLKKNHNIELQEVRTFIGAEAVERLLLMLQAAVAHKETLTLEYLKSKVDWHQMPELNIALQEAISKVMAQMIALKPRIDGMKAQAEELAAMNTPTPAPAVQ